MEFKKLIVIGMLACSTVVGLQAAQANVYEQEQVIVPQFYEIQNWIQSAAKDRETVLTDEQVYVWFENEVKTFKDIPCDPVLARYRTQVLEHLVGKEAYKTKTITTAARIFSVVYSEEYLTPAMKVAKILAVFFGGFYFELQCQFVVSKKGKVGFIFDKNKKLNGSNLMVIPGVDVSNSWHAQAFNWVANNKLKTAGMVLTAVAAADLARHKGNPKAVWNDVKRLGGWLKSFVR